VTAGRADHSEFERVNPQFALLLQPKLESGTGVLRLEVLIFVGSQHRKVGLVPRFEVCELVVRRQVGVSLTIALVLGDFVERLSNG